MAVEDRASGSRCSDGDSASVVGVGSVCDGLVDDSDHAGDLSLTVEDRASGVRCSDGDSASVVGVGSVGDGLPGHSNHAEDLPLAVEVTNWGWRYSGRKAWAARNISFEVKPHERVLLLGASGAGKSTLMQGLAGVLGGSDEGETEGTIRIFAEDPQENKGLAGLVLQDPESQVVMSRMGDDLAFGCENQGLSFKEIWERVEQTSKEVGLNFPLDHDTTALSGGQKQRMAFGGVMAMNPKVLLLDEPTANLDSNGVMAVKEAIARIVCDRQATVIIVEHRVDTWLDLIDRVIVLGPEGVIADGDPNEIWELHRDLLAEAGVWVPKVHRSCASPVHSDLALQDSKANQSVAGGSSFLVGRDDEGSSEVRADGGLGLGVQDSKGNQSVEGGSSFLVGRDEEGASEVRSDAEPSTSSARFSSAEQERSHLHERSRSHSAGLVGSSVFELRDVSLAYGSRRDKAVGSSEAETIRHLHVDIPLGGITCITGANGAGKSTLALHLSGLLPAVSGSTVVHEVVRQGLAEANPNLWSSQDLALRIGMVFQEPEFQFMTQTVFDELALGPRTLGRIVGGSSRNDHCASLADDRGEHSRRSPSSRLVNAQSEPFADSKDQLDFAGLHVGSVDEAQVHELLDQLHLSHLAKAHPLTLSGGEKRRLSVATALITRPELLILDEPTFGQDYRRWLELVELIRSLGRTQTIIAITHDMPFAQAVGDHVLLLDSSSKQTTMKPLSSFAPQVKTSYIGDAAKDQGSFDCKDSKDDYRSQVVEVSCVDDASEDQDSKTRKAIKAGDLAPTQHEPRILLERINPLIRLLGLAIMTTPLVLSIDHVSALTALGLEVLLLPFLGVRFKHIAPKLGYLAIILCLSGISMLLYGKAGGTVYADIGFITISDNSISLAVGLALRFLALIIPALVLFVDLDPTDLGDALAQVGKLPAVMAISFVAGMRTVGLMHREWDALQRARRARGQENQRMIPKVFGMSFALLVIAMRRGIKLTTTMEARGFGVSMQRTWARPSHLHKIDLVILAFAVLIPSISIAAALWAGTFRLFGVID